MNKFLTFGLASIIGLLVFGFLYSSQPEKEVYYEIGLFGIKDQYFVGEELKFAIFLNGYGDSCGTILAEVLKGDQIIQSWIQIPRCQGPSGEKLRDLENYTSNLRTFKLELSAPGLYTVTGSFERGDYGKIEATESFIVIEN